MQQSFDNKNYYLILNYLILLNAFKFDYKKTNILYLKYFDVLNQKIMNCIFNFENNDKKIFNYINESIIKKCIETINNNSENIIFIFEYQWLWSIKSIEAPFLLFFSGNLLLLKNKVIYIDNNKNNLSYSITDYCVNNSLTTIVLLNDKNHIFNEKFLEKKNYNNLIGITNMPIGYYDNDKIINLYDYIQQNGLLISYLPSFDFKIKNRLDKQILCLISSLLIFNYDNRVNEFINYLDLIEAKKCKPYIVRNRCNTTDEKIWKIISEKYVDSIYQIDCDNQLFEILKTINN